MLYDGHGLRTIVGSRDEAWQQVAGEAHAEGRALYLEAVWNGADHLPSIGSESRLLQNDGGPHEAALRLEALGATS